MRPGPALTLGLTASAVTIAAAAGCWRVGEPVPGKAKVSWAAYPETVRVGEVFSFEFAGPVSPDGCARMDSARLAVEDSTIRLAADRSRFPDALCADQRMSFYEARPLTIDRPGRYRVVTAGGTDLGALVAVTEGDFSRMRARGEGTLRRAGGCVFFGPGWASNQRPFALRRLPPRAEAVAGTDTLVRIRGTLYGFDSCGAFGSRPAIRVTEARVTGRTGADHFAGDAGEPARAGGSADPPGGDDATDFEPPKEGEPE